MLKGEVLKGKPRQMLTRPGRLRARSGSKLPTANVPLRALKDGVQKINYFLLKYVRHSLGYRDLVDLFEVVCNAWLRGKEGCQPFCFGFIFLTDNG